jgi:ABC-type polysaccharide/polyol phosphate transport system ATPase subunit
MSDLVIRAERLGKKYRIGRRIADERYTALRDVVARSAKGFARSARDMLQGRSLVAGDAVEEFWALKDVDFEIRRGDVVGIMGGNGAGKSTLLKILSRIAEPTAGRVEIRGRVASLLEIGAGFHPELTGHENIFLNGAILGMSREEIRRKFDEIVAFAEVETFLDTPVKRYSSGMYMRLAFAVAAHLEPDILLVDEVLAVGDAEFQRKCLGKMESVASRGRTVLFVSHNTGALARTCKTGWVLERGRMRLNASIEEAMEAYQSLSPAASGKASLAARHRDAPRDARIKITDFRCVTEYVRQGQPFVAEFAVTVHEKIRSVIFGIGFSDLHGNRILSCDSDYIGKDIYHFSNSGTYAIRLRIESLNLASSTYCVDVGCRREGGEMLDSVLAAVTICIHPSIDTIAAHAKGYRTALVHATWEDALAFDA